jgi:hypothetical protein
MMNYGDSKQIEADAIQILAMMMIARIDGKSPVEYISSETTKQLVRDMAQKLLKDGVKSYQEAAGLFYAAEKAIQGTV